MKTSFAVERLLPLAFVTSAVTGIGLHIAGHGTNHEVWHGWAVVHVLSAYFGLRPEHSISSGIDVGIRHSPQTASAGKAG